MAKLRVKVDVYNNVDIYLSESQYDRDVDPKNPFEFELRGRLRRAPTLTKAREFIDKEPKAKPAKGEEWKPFMAVYASDAEDIATSPENVEVTSYAGVSKYASRNDRHEFWVKRADGSRRKVEAWSLFVTNHNNKVIFGEIQQTYAMYAELCKKLKQLYDKLETVKPTTNQLQEE